MKRERTPAADLGGTKVLVVEDEFYLAMDIAEEIEQAGGTVLGPCRDADASMEQLDAGPDVAVVDINLGEGPSFVIARTLRTRGVPFLFLTGYDIAAIPTEFADIESVSKSANAARVIDAIARLTAREAAS